MSQTIVTGLVPGCASSSERFLRRFEPIFGEPLLFHAGDLRTLPQTGVVIVAPADALGIELRKVSRERRRKLIPRLISVDGTADDDEILLESKVAAIIPALAYGLFEDKDAAAGRGPVSCGLIGLRSVGTALGISTMLRFWGEGEYAKLIHGSWTIAEVLAHYIKRYRVDVLNEEA